MPVLLMKNDDAELEGGHDKEGSGSTRSSPRWGEGRGFARRRLKRKPVLGERGGCHQQLGDHSHVAMCHQGPGLPLPSKKAQCSRKPVADRASPGRARVPALVSPFHMHSGPSESVSAWKQTGKMPTLVPLPSPVPAETAPTAALMPSSPGFKPLCKARRRSARVPPPFPLVDPLNL